MELFKYFCLTGKNRYKLIYNDEYIINFINLYDTNYNIYKLMDFLYKKYIIDNHIYNSKFKITDIILPGYYTCYNIKNNKDFLYKRYQLYQKLYPCLYNLPIKQQKNKFKKIGFISSKFFDTSSMHTNINTILNISKKLFDVYTLFITKPIDNIGFKLYNNTKSIILNNNYYDMIKQVYELNFDLLIYCDIGMDNLYFLACNRLAPIQITTWGHSETSGITNIDYYISSKIFEPIENQIYYTEKLILFNSLGFYYDYIFNDINSNDINSNNYILCIQNPKKFTNEFISNLNNIKNIQIIFIKYNNTDIHIFDKFICDIKILDFMSQFQMKSIISNAILLLDTEFCGCNTSLQGFECDKIIITKYNKYLRTRFTKGFYDVMGLNNIPCKTYTDYIDKLIFYYNNNNERLKIENIIKKNKYKLFRSNESINEWNNFLNNICY